MRLEELDRVLDGSHGFHVVDELTLTESGIDPIGLRQLNLDLMEATVPGINNVTEHIRPYTFMAWAWWRASQYARRYGLTPETVADLVARYEAIYAWSHSLAGRPFRGEITVKKYLNPDPGSDAFTFEGSNWKKFVDERTGFMAPTEYGPSIKSLRFLIPDEGLFQWASQAEEAIRAIDEIVSNAVPERLLAPEPPAATLTEIRPLAVALPIDQPTEAEKSAFRHLFHGIGADEGASVQMRRRKATIDLLRSMMTETGPDEIAGLRRNLASLAVADHPDGDALAIGESALMLCHLQSRQLQRLATEALLMWLERFLDAARGAPRPIGEIVDEAHAQATKEDPVYASSATVGEYMGLVRDMGGEAGWPTAAGRSDIDVVTLLGGLEKAQQKEVWLVPSLAMRSLAVVAAVTRAFPAAEHPEGVFNAIEERPDRMPMGVMTRRIESLSDRPLTALWREIFERWIIGQHVHWSAVRGGDGKKRLRIGLEGDGWMLVRSKPSGAFDATSDRLWTLLSLGTACGLFERDSAGRYRSTQAASDL